MVLRPWGVITLHACFEPACRASLFVLRRRRTLLRRAKRPRFRRKLGGGDRSASRPASALVPSVRHSGSVKFDASRIILGLYKRAAATRDHAFAFALASCR